MYFRITFLIRSSINLDSSSIKTVGRIYSVIIYGYHKQFIPQRRVKKMVKTINKFILRYGLSISAFAIMVAALSSDLCRGEWYQPKEPENLHKIIENDKKAKQHKH